MIEHPVIGKVAAVLTAHPARVRRGHLSRALDSVVTQTHPVHSVHIAVDLDGDGAAVTRDRALSQVDPSTTPWVAFLDSDDAWMPQHIERLLGYAQRHDADYVYSWYTIRDGAGRTQLGWDPFPEVFGKAFDPANPVQTTVTTLVRTEFAQAVGFAPRPDRWMRPHPDEDVPTPTGHRAGEDWRFTLGCIDAHAKIVHLPERTWYWYHHGLNSSGCPGKGDA